MLEGLEIKEVLFSSVNSSELLRLEAEFHTAKSFNSSSTYIGAEIIDFSQYGTSDELNEESKGYPVLRLNEFDSHFITTPSKFCNLLDEETYQSLRLRRGDVLICRTNGNPRLVGKSAIVPKDYDYAYASYLFKIRPKQELITPATLVAYLNSKFGRMEIEKFSMASNQVNFSPAKFREMRIPKFGHALNAQVDKNTFDAFELLEKSKLFHTQAETLLIDTLGMAGFSPNTDSINVKSLKDSFAATGRLDAEYYQPKYEDYQARVRSYPNGWQPLMQACNLKDRNFTPDELIAYKYIELADIDNYGGITGCTEALGNELPSRARRIVDAGDVLISSVEGSLSSCAIVPGIMGAALCSTGFYVINSDKINSETLLILFKSPLLQNLLKQGCSGTILTAINKTEFQNIPVPIIEGGAQTKIATLVKESFSLKAESERLLDVAKRAVEIAIEQDENAALDWLFRNTPAQKAH